MHFVCNSDSLMHAVHVVEKAISQRSALPVLENIYMDLVGSTLRLRGNDLEIGIDTSLEVENKGGDASVLVKAKTFSSILSKLQHQSLEISVDSSYKMIIKNDQLDFDILCLSSQEYPAFPDIEEGVSFELSVGVLRDLIKHTIFSVSFDETKQFLNGILMKYDLNELLFVATDGYRLSLKREMLSISDKPFSVIVPYKAVNELNKIFQAVNVDTKIAVSVSDNQVSFSGADILLVSRVIKGQFPDYRQVLPERTEFSFSVKRRALLDACERASIIAVAANNVVRLSFSEAQLTIRANASGMGEFKEELALTRHSGSEEVVVAFNVKLVMDAIRILESDDVKVSFNGGLSPCLIQSPVDESYTYIIMPIRTSEYQNVSDASVAVAQPQETEEVTPVSEAV